MRRAAQFLFALVAVLALLAFVGDLVLTRTARAWFEHDVALRSRLAVASAQKSLTATWAEPEGLSEVLSDITRDDRIMGAAACAGSKTAIAATDSYPPEFSCQVILDRLRAAGIPFDGSRGIAIEAASTCKASGSCCLPTASPTFTRRPATARFASLTRPAGLRKRTRELFTTLCQLYPTAVISGRSRRDVTSKLRGCQVKYVIGNHGLEPGTNLRTAKASLDAARARLSTFASVTQGIDLEDKRYSLAVHYRRSRNRRVAELAIRRTIKGLAVPMRVIGGKCVVNLVPANAPNKGDALLMLRGKAGADTALYVGDDVTDEDVFRIDQPGRLLSVRVGRSSSSAAAYFLKGQSEVDALLATLISFRSRMT